MRGKNSLTGTGTLAMMAAGILAAVFAGGMNVSAQETDGSSKSCAGIAVVLEEEMGAGQSWLTADAAGEAALYERLLNRAYLSGGSSLEDFDLAMTSVQNTLNVRTEPDEGAEKAGYLYADCGGSILERRNGWTKLQSGRLTGWAKDEYLLFGDNAWEEAKKVGHIVATVTGETLRIRKEPSDSAEVYALAGTGEKFELVDDDQLEYSDGIKITEEWAAVDYEGKTGYVSARYISVDFQVDSGETLTDIAERQKAAEDQRSRESAQAANGKNPGKASSGKSGSASARESTNAVSAGVSDSLLLAALIQCEAGGESYEGQLAVGAVVLNRVKSSSYPNTISDVIYASGQFGPASSGRLAGLLQSGKVKQSCQQAAAEALAGITNVGGATHFRRAGNREGILIGNHVFW